jgi:radical SAM superfamily enzyme YgiQ (UPF0313 family)
MGDGLRVLLVYANPHQALPVSPYGLEILRATLHRSGLPVEARITNPFLESLDPPGHLLAVLDELRPDLIGLSIRNLDNAVVVVDPRRDPRPSAAAGNPVDIVGYIDDIADLVEVIRRWDPRVPVVGGGAAFGACPELMMDHLGLDIGFVGPGEDGFVALASGLLQGMPVRQTAAALPNAVVRNPDTGRPRRTFGRSAPVDIGTAEPVLAGIAPEYVWFGKLLGIAAAVRTKAGCPLRCAYCVDHVNLRRTGLRPVAHVRAEIEHYVTRYGLTRFHLADPEVNLPYEEHLLDLCGELAASPVADRIAWHGYFNVKPFSDRLLDGLARSRCVRPSFAVDAFDDGMLAGHQKNFRLADVEDLMDRIGRRRPEWMGVEVGVLLGQPGETWRTVDAAIAGMRRLADSGVRVAYACGLRVYPGTPLSRRGLDPRHLYRPAATQGAPVDGLHPVVYCEPAPPRELVAYVAERLAERPEIGVIDEGEILEARRPPWLRPFNVGVVRLANGDVPGALSHLATVEREGGAVRVARLLDFATRPRPGAPAVSR